MASLREILDSRRHMLKISLNLDEGDGKIDLDLYDELSFNQDNILDHVENHGALVAWYSTIHLETERRLATLQREYDVWYARQYEDQYRDLSGDGKKKPNINSVANAVMLENREVYNEFHENLETARYQVAILQSVCRWLQEKGQMLIQACKYYALEYQTASGSIPVSRQDYENRSQKAVDELNKQLTG